MKMFATGLTAATAMFATAAAADAQMLCSDRDSVIEKLSQGYHEEPVAMGLTSSGSVIEVLSSGADGQTWTIIVTQPDGVSCVMATGESWQSVDRELAMNEGPML